MSKQFYFKQLSLPYVDNLNVKTDLFQTIQFNYQFKYQMLIFDQ